jgi:hypothetical protein
MTAAPASLAAFNDGTHLGRLEIDEKVAEVDSAHGFPDGRHEDVIDHRSDDFPESGADDHAHRQVHDTATHGELFELLDESHICFPFVWFTVLTFKEAGGDNPAEDTERQG